jgi:hypothetical protein
MTAPCPAHLADGPLVCIRTDAHEPHRGCVFQSTSGQAHVPKEGI